MKLFEINNANLATELERNLVKAYATLKNSGVGTGGKATLKQITTKFINLVDDGLAFSKYYSKMLGEKPDAMDFYLEELFSLCNVKNVEQFFAKYFPKLKD